ncbi:MAG: endo-1,4-beta-xylanase [Lachnospiraceae bacterium]|nr:endo-1,4-beta-xylanase [Lachnospiraceae bacterium]
MIRKCTLKRLCLVMLGLCLVIPTAGCGTQQGVENINETIVTQNDTSEQQEPESEPESQPVSQADTEQDGTPVETTPEEISSEEELSEEDLYWQEVLGEFGNSRYDLTAALTEPALKDYCSDYFTLGVGLNGSTLENQTLNMPEYMAVASKHFNSCTMTNLMKSSYILDQQGSRKSASDGDGSPVLSFATIDPTLEWCQQNGMQMRGHTLVWHAQAPDWFFREGYTDNGKYVDRETMLFRMESYIAQLMTHVQDNYPGVVYCWDVVNEAVDPDKGDKDSFFLCRTENDGVPNPWYVTIGEDYVEMAFTYARKYAAEDVKLFYNDFNTYQTEKRDAIYALCESLKEKGLIDGIGMQGYWGVDYPTIGVLEITIRKFAELDLEIHITELSVGVDEEDEESFEKQGQRYASIFMSLKQLDKEGGGSANITNVTFFGLIDHYRQGDTTNSRLFDSVFQPKPAFYRICNMLKTIYSS